MNTPVSLNEVGDLLRPSPWVYVEEDLLEQFRTVLRSRPDLLREIRPGESWEVWSGDQALSLAAYSRTESDRDFLPGLQGPIRQVLVVGWTEKLGSSAYGGAIGSCMNQAAVARVMRRVISFAGDASRYGQMALL